MVIILLLCLSYNIHNIKFRNIMSLTLTTCWYVLKSKFNKSIYLNWINNILEITNNFNLVIYTNYEEEQELKALIKNNNKIKIIIKNLEEFYTYKYI